MCSLLRASLYLALCSKKVSLESPWQSSKFTLESSPPWGRKRASSLHGAAPRSSKEECRQQSCGWAAVCRQHSCLVTFLGMLFLHLDCESYSELSAQSSSCAALSDLDDFSPCPAPSYFAPLLEL